MPYTCKVNIKVNAPTELQESGSSLADKAFGLYLAELMTLEYPTDDPTPNDITEGTSSGLEAPHDGPLCIKGTQNCTVHPAR